MFNRDRFIDSIFSTSSEDFNEKALDLFHYQSQYNEVYKNYLHYLGRSVNRITHVHEIPFLPVRFFKTHAVQSGIWEPDVVFSSSSTTGTGQSYHRVKSTRIYKESFLKSFSLFAGAPESFIICAVLPSYREREGSSLIYMVEELIQKSVHPLSGFYAHDNNLPDTLKHLQQQAKSANRTLLIWSVSFALLDLAEREQIHLHDSVLMETGGMKGRRTELTRIELHARLQHQLSPKAIWSEYGMTELMSQAYLITGHLFQCPPWMKVLVRNTTDPFQLYDKPGKTGVVNVIDLANVDSCAFIATDDIGRMHEKGFELNGRLDHSDIRGCNLLFA